ncbi:MAG: response regulator [Spirochaetes bacterium]|nr:response regulator [Spirochaetota bacterium]
MYKKILNNAIDFSFSLISFVTDAKCMGIRLKGDDINNQYRFYKTIGYRRSFLKEVDCIHNKEVKEKLDCMCGQVIQGPAKEIENDFTKFGSYWGRINDDDFFNKFSDHVELKDNCLSEGFGSLALIPLKTRKGCKGLFHIADYHENKFNIKKISKLEKISQNFSSLILGIETAVDEIKKNGLKLLIVEDETDLNDLLYTMLKGFDYNCHRVYNGKEAYNYICKHKVDIVITDIKMPVMDGMELIKKVKNQLLRYGPKFIVLSGHTGMMDNKMIKKYNISHIIQKPVSLAALKHVIEDVRNNN